MPVQLRRKELIDGARPFLGDLGVGAVQEGKQRLSIKKLGIDGVEGGVLRQTKTVRASTGLLAPHPQPG